MVAGRTGAGPLWLEGAVP